MSKNSINLENTVSSAAILITVLQFLSGVVICRTFIKKKSTGEMSGFPFVCGFLSCSLWIKYGLLTNENSVVLVNTIGCILFFAYTIIYYIFTINKNITIRQFAIVCFLIISVISYTQYETDVKKAINTVGILCCIVTILFVAAPFTNLFHVIKVRSTESLPFPLILTAFFVSTLWFVFGVLIQDAFLQITNFIGLIMSASQLSLFFCYPSKVVQKYSTLEQSVVF